jgi:hypothetical protein
MQEASDQRYTDKSFLHRFAEFPAILITGGQEGRGIALCFALPVLHHYRSVDYNEAIEKICIRILWEGELGK